MPDDHVAINRTNWNADAPNWVERGRRSWSADEPFWGTWGSPESEVGLLPDVDGLDAVELGCGTAYVSAWLARKGARAVAMDVSEEQLATARTFQEEFDLHFPLHSLARFTATSASTYLVRVQLYFDADERAYWWVTFNVPYPFPPFSYGTERTYWPVEFGRHIE